MKKFIFLCLTAFFFTLSFANVRTEKKPLYASEVFIPVGNTGMKISFEDLSRIKVKDFEILTGQKMKLMDRVSFKIAQRSLKKSINPDGTFNQKRLENAARKMADGQTGFHVGGFALGFLLGLIGVIIAYIIKDDKKRNRVKWAWIGWAVWLIIWLAVILPSL